MGQTAPALCTECGGTYEREEEAMTISDARAEAIGKALTDNLAEKLTCKHSWVPEGGLIQDGIAMVCEKCGEPKESNASKQ
jgi:hypothetical protein